MYTQRTAFDEWKDDSIIYNAFTMPTPHKIVCGSLLSILCGLKGLSMIAKDPADLQEKIAQKTRVFAEATNHFKDSILEKISLDIPSVGTLIQGTRKGITEVLEGITQSDIFLTIGSTAQSVISILQ